MFFSMMVMSCVIEQPWRKLGPSTSDYFSDLDNSLRTISTALFGAGIAIVMVLCEFWLILKSNAIVLMIGGVLKEMITIFVG
jgi:solute carrier family 35 protein C2